MSIIIAIDGPAGSGKGTLARGLAARLGYAYLDTGALYRAVALEVFEAGGDPELEADAVRGAETLIGKISTAASPDVFLNNSKLREERIGDGASKVAAVQDVRDKLIQFQRDFATTPGEGHKGAILDGRDIGTVICPDADVKLYVQADMETRAARRTKELQSKGIDVTKAHVLQDMQARDERDMQRQAAPLAQAEDAIVFDTSDLDVDEMIEKALKIIEKRLLL